jgi:hypothetical protein
MAALDKIRLTGLLRKGPAHGGAFLFVGYAGGAATTEGEPCPHRSFASRF